MKIKIFSYFVFFMINVNAITQNLSIPRQMIQLNEERLQRYFKTVNFCSGCIGLQLYSTYYVYVEASVEEGVELSIYCKTCTEVVELSNYGFVVCSYKFNYEKMEIDINICDNININIAIFIFNSLFKQRNYVIRTVGLRSTFYLYHISVKWDELVKEKNKRKLTLTVINNGSVNTNVADQERISVKEEVELASLLKDENTIRKFFVFFIESNLEMNNDVHVNARRAFSIFERMLISLLRFLNIFFNKEECSEFIKLDLKQIKLPTLEVIVVLAEIDKRKDRTPFSSSFSKYHSDIFSKKLENSQCTNTKPKTKIEIQAIINRLVDRKTRICPRIISLNRSHSSDNDYENEQIKEFVSHFLSEFILEISRNDSNNTFEKIFSVECLDYTNKDTKTSESSPTNEREIKDFVEKDLKQHGSIKITCLTDMWIKSDKQKFKHAKYLFLSVNWNNFRDIASYMTPQYISIHGYDYKKIATFNYIYEIDDTITFHFIDYKDEWVDKCRYRKSKEYLVCYERR